MANLNTKTVQVYPTPQTPVPQFVTIPVPLSYEFRVVEHCDDVGKVVKVELQVTTNEHYEDGSVAVTSGWVPVPRVKLSKDGLIIL